MTLTGTVRGMEINPTDDICFAIYAMLLLILRMLFASRYMLSKTINY